MGKQSLRGVLRLCSFHSPYHDAPKSSGPKQKRMNTLTRMGGMEKSTQWINVWAYEGQDAVLREKLKGLETSKKSNLCAVLKTEPNQWKTENYPSKGLSSPSMTGIWGWIAVHSRGCPIHHRVCSSTPGLDPQNPLRTTALNEIDVKSIKVTGYCRALPSSSASCQEFFFSIIRHEPIKCRITILKEKKRIPPPNYSFIKDITSI